MNKEEIDDWLRYFSNNNQGFMSKDGKKITLFKVFQELKELQRLLKIQNDYINELEQKNQELKDNWNKLKEWTTKAVDKYYDCDLKVDMVYKNVLDRMQELEKSDGKE